MLDTIERQARSAAETDFNSGRAPTKCPYTPGTSEAKRWVHTYLLHEFKLLLGLEKPFQIISTFSGGACEQLEEARA